MVHTLLEILENSEAMFPRQYMHSDTFSLYKYPTHTSALTSAKGLNTKTIKQ